jgi:hypothetical protein
MNYGVTFIVLAIAATIKILVGDFVCVGDGCGAVLAGAVVS